MKRAILMFLLVSLSAAYGPPSFAADQPVIATVLSAPAKADIGTKTQCAVCGMKLRVKADQPVAEYKGKDYYFCDAAERDAFVQSPSMYIEK
jgi:YHS domain-containing protein